MTARGIGITLLLSVILWVAIIALLICAARAAFALDYELWAERPGAELRADQPNVRRVDRPTYPSFTDCLDALATDKGLRNERGWRLRCRPTEAAPVPRLVVK